MTFLDFLAEKGLTIYRISSLYGIPQTTLMDVGSGKRDLSDCTGKTLLKLSKALDTSIEELLALEPEEARSSMPDFLYESIQELRKNIRKRTMRIDCYSDQLISNLNICDVENLISKEMLARLRNRYC